MFQRAKSAARLLAAGIFLLPPFIDAAGRFDDTLVEVLPPGAVAENAGSAEIVLRRGGSTRWPATVTLLTRDGDAVAGADYEALAIDVVFATGEQEKRVPVGIVDDGEPEGDEHFYVELAAGSNVTLDTDVLDVAILDDDVVLEMLEPLSEYDPHWPKTGVFAAAEDCATCHSASTDSDPLVPPVLRYPLSDTGEDVSPGAGWRHSMMAHALNDPYFLAIVEEEASLFPDKAGFIEDTCLTCHAPMARTHAHMTGNGLDTDGHYRLDTALGADMAREGVSCTLCHQIADDGRLGDGAFSGDYTISDTAQVIYGGYSDPAGSVMQRFSGYTPVTSDHVGASAHCATCHVLYTPVLDTDTGDPTGDRFLEQGVYFEWQDSAFGDGREREAQCQDCHMPSPEPGEYATRLALRPNGTVNTAWPVRGPVPAYRQHDIVGANTYGLSLLSDARDLLGIASSTTVAGFARQIDKTRAMLGERTAELALDLAAVREDTLALDVTVINRSGHKLPTSYPSRRVWLNVQVRDGQGNLVFESGTPDARGRIAPDAAALAADCLLPDKPADFVGDACYSPHYDVITEPEQVAVYESVLGDTAGDITYVLLKGAAYLKDNRIPPEGTLPATQHPDTRSVGVEGDGDYNADGSGQDTVHYRIALGQAEGPFDVEARLLYQSVRPAFVHSLGGHGTHGERFRELAESRPPMVEELAVAKETVLLSRNR